MIEQKQQRDIEDKLADHRKQEGIPASADCSAEAEDSVHPLAVSAGVAVGKKRNHADTDSDSDVQRKPLGFQDNADCRKLNVAVSGSQTVDHDIALVRQEDGDTGRKADPEDFLKRLHRGIIAVHADPQDGGLTDIAVNRDEVAHGNDIGKSGRNGGAEHLHAVRKKHL